MQSAPGRVLVVSRGRQKLQQDPPAWCPHSLSGCALSAAGWRSKSRFLLLVANCDELRGVCGTAWGLLCCPDSAGNIQCPRISIFEWRQVPGTHKYRNRPEVTTT